MTLGTHVLDTADFAIQLAAMIGLGVGIDYALFILTRFRNGLDEGLEPQEAAARAIDTAGRAVLFAGVTVIISLLGMLLLGVDFLYGVAVAAALAVTMTMIASLTLLPALLASAGRRVDRLRVPGLGKRRALADLELGRWYRWSATIQRHPISAMLLSGGLLLVLCIPALVAVGLQRRRLGPGRDDDQEGLRPPRRGLRPRLQRPVRGRRRTPEQGRRRRATDLHTEIEEQPGVASSRLRRC